MPGTDRRPSEDLREAVQEREDEPEPNYPEFDVRPLTKLPGPLYAPKEPAGVKRRILCAIGLHSGNVEPLPAGPAFCCRYCEYRDSAPRPPEI